MSRVSIIGSGNVGANAAFFVAEKGVTDVLLVDVKPGLSRGKALDISEAAPIRRYRSTLTGSDELADIRGSQMVVLAAGASLRPGQRREELFTTNAPIVRQLAPEVARLAPDSVVVVATEPVDPLTTLFVRSSGMPRERVLGLGGIVDATRFRALVARELDLSMEIVSAIVIGPHSDDMIVLPRYCTVSGVPLPLLAAPERISALVQETRAAESLVVDLARRSSAYYAPSAAIAELADAVHMSSRRIFCVSLLLKGEYGAGDAALSLPAVIDAGGAARVLTPEIAPGELRAFRESARRVAAVAAGGTG